MNSKSNHLKPNYLQMKLKSNHSKQKMNMTSVKRNELELRNRTHKWWLGRYINRIQKPSTHEIKYSNLALMNLNLQTKVQKLKSPIGSSEPNQNQTYATVDGSFSLQISLTILAVVAKRYAGDGLESSISFQLELRMKPDAIGWLGRRGRAMVEDMSL